MFMDLGLKGSGFMDLRLKGLVIMFWGLRV